jgi:hypothetical protein
MTHPEVLESGPASDRTTRSRVLTTTLAVAVLVLGVAGWWWDNDQRDDENQAITACVRGAERSAQYAEARIDGMRTYIRPVLGSDASAGTRSGLLELVQEQAQKTLPAVEVASERCRTTRIRGWHGEQEAAQTAYGTYFEARLAVLRAIARDGGRNLTDDQGVPQLRAAATEALRAADLRP